MASLKWVGTDPRHSDLIQELNVLEAAMVKRSLHFTITRSHSIIDIKQFLLPSEVVNGSALLWKCLISMMLWIKQHTVQFGSLHIHHMGHSQTCPVCDYDGAELNTYTVMTKSLK